MYNNDYEDIDDPVMRWYLMKIDKHEKKEIDHIRNLKNIQMNKQKI